MKTEERKKEDCELLDKFKNGCLPSSQTKNQYTFTDRGLNQFKADNDLLPKRIELSKEEWNERLGEFGITKDELEEKLNELRKLV